MTRGNSTYWLVIAAVILLAIAALFLMNDSNPQHGGVVLHGPSSQTAAPRSDVAAAAHNPTEVQRLIDSGQFAPPPGNPEKMYSIASPFAASAPATANATGNPVNNPGAQAGTQPTRVLLGASAWNSAPTHDTSKTSPGQVGYASGPAPSQAQHAPLEFETPPGIGSAKGGQ